MPLTRQVTIDDKTAFVLDRELCDEELRRLTRELSYERAFSRSELRLADRTEERSWVSAFDLAEFQASPIGRRTQELVELCYPNEHQRLLRAYGSMTGHGDVLSIHRDCPLFDADVTAVWFIADVWERDWRGELLLFDEHYDAQAAITPQPGRLCPFRGALPHSSTPPSRLCYQPRLTVICKCAPQGADRHHAWRRQTFASVAAVFNHIAELLVSRPPTGADATYQFLVSGTGGGTWFLQLTPNGGTVANDERTAALTITLDVDTFLDAVNGRINAAKAFALGRIVMKGRIGLVMHLRELIWGA